MKSKLPAIDMLLSGPAPEDVGELSKIRARFISVCARKQKFKDALVNNDIVTALEMSSRFDSMLESMYAKEAILLGIGFDEYLKNVVALTNGILDQDWNLIAIRPLLSQSCIIIPPTVKSIGSQAFSFNDVSISAIYIPKAVKLVNWSAFDISDEYLTIYFEDDSYKHSFSIKEIKCKVEFNKTLEDFERECM